MLDISNIFKRISSNLYRYIFNEYNWEIKMSYLPSGLDKFISEEIKIIKDIISVHYHNDSKV